MVRCCWSHGEEGRRRVESKSQGNEGMHAAAASSKEGRTLVHGAAAAAAARGEMLHMGTQE